MVKVVVLDLPVIGVCVLYALHTPYEECIALQYCVTVAIPVLVVV